ncbi:MAG: glutamyl-tRNA reductase [Leptospiraceae bacterium]|nr:glutamyl-tRNA reductase [Leptospiraceae bacterium]MCP5494944.1 glutamyl-tRNA reductase [Leptospiraceae bacterium]
MWSNLLVLHSESKNRDKEHFPDLFRWKTCMRTLFVGDLRTIDSNLSIDGTSYTWHEGYDAYKLLLEIVSGIRSRLLGETEIFAQFKEAFKNDNLPNSAFGDYLYKLRDQLIEDSRKIRSKYLRNLGDQSYGGLAHRYLKNINKVTLLGTGQLAIKLLPWLLKGREVKVVGRNQEKLLEISKQFPVSIEPLYSYEMGNESLAIAAPMSVTRWIDQADDGIIVVDFREIDMNDKFPEDRLTYISFESMLNSLKENESKNRRLKEKLKRVVVDIVEERELESQHFIYGWEDIPCMVY